MKKINIHYPIGASLKYTSHEKTFLLPVTTNKYVQHEGPLTAELKSEFSLTSSGDDIAGSVSFRFKSGIGSIPEVPTEKCLAIR
jgi:hypothetical protein